MLTKPSLCPRKPQVEQVPWDWELTTMPAASHKGMAKVTDFLMFSGRTPKCFLAASIRCIVMPGNTQNAHLPT